MIETIEDHRTDLEKVAESDLSCNWIAQALLDETDTEA